MRVVRRARTDLSPKATWKALGPVKQWHRWMHYPEDEPPVERVKILRGGKLGPGAHLHVLRTDHAWTRFRLTDWAPQRRVVLAAEASGMADAPETSPLGPIQERLIVIPQGSGAELEWLVDMGTGVRALLRRGTVDKEAWQAALDRRLEALIAAGGGTILPGPGELAAEAER